MSDAPKQQTSFAPQLLIDNGVKDISFYERAFGAVENFCFHNDDESVHVAELMIDGAIFHIHEISQPHYLTPEKAKGVTALIGLFVDDVDEYVKRAVAAGAVEKSPVRDYEQGYRQATIIDPFGHEWKIEKKIGA
jgi:PhnB protein